MDKNKHDLTIYCLQETHLIFKDKNRLNINECKKYIQTVTKIGWE